MSSTIDAVLRKAVDSGAVPHAVAVAADRNGVIYEGAAGSTVAGGDDPVSPDTHFRIMSMTKIVITVAALQQVEKGTLDLDAPVDSYRPEFAEVQVPEGFEGDTPRLRPPTSRATVKQLITHTAGLSYWFWNEDIALWESVTGTPNVLSGSNVIFEGTTILQQSTLDAAFTNQIGDLDFPAAIETADTASTFGFFAGPGHKWGYGLLLNTADVPGRRRAGSGAWAGLMNTHFWVDPAAGVTGAIYSQFLPFVPEEALGVYADFERALYASL